MRARRTIFSDCTFELQGGNEDNTLWATSYGPKAGGPAHGSVWVPTDEERTRIAAGENVELIVFGEQHPAVAMRLNDYPLGRPPVGEPG